MVNHGYLLVINCHLFTSQKDLSSYSVIYHSSQLMSEWIPRMRRGAPTIVGGYDTNSTPGKLGHLHSEAAVFN